MIIGILYYIEKLAKEYVIYEYEKKVRSIKTLQDLEFVLEIIFSCLALFTWDCSVIWVDFIKWAGI